MGGVSFEVEVAGDLGDVRCCCIDGMCSRCQVLYYFLGLSLGCTLLVRL